MLDLPDAPVIDKQRLLGGCLRLPLEIDGARLAREVAALSDVGMADVGMADVGMADAGTGDAVWGTTGGRVGVHSAAEAVFLRGHAPAAGAREIADRPVLDRLPYAREVMALIGAPPQRCLLARLRGGRTIAPHVDRAPYFSKTVRIHVPVTTHERVYMLCAGASYRMRVGEVWALDNGAPHGVWNADEARERIHMICDFTLSPRLTDLLARSERHLGERIDEVERHLAAFMRPAGMVRAGD